MQRCVPASVIACVLAVGCELLKAKTNRSAAFHHAGALQIRLDDPANYQSIVDAEWDIIYSKLDNIAASGAKVCGRSNADQSPHRRDLLVHNFCIFAGRTHVTPDVSSQPFFQRLVSVAC